MVMSTWQADGILVIENSHGEKNLLESEGVARLYKHPPIIRRPGDPLSVLDGATTVVYNGPNAGGSVDEVNYVWELAKEKGVNVVFVAHYVNTQEFYNFYKSPLADLLEKFEAGGISGCASNEDFVVPDSGLTFKQRFSKVFMDSLKGKVVNEWKTYHARSIVYKGGKYRRELENTRCIGLLSDLMPENAAKSKMLLECRNIKPENVFYYVNLEIDELDMLRIDENRVTAPFGSHFSHKWMFEYSGIDSSKLEELRRYKAKVAGCIPVPESSASFDFVGFPLSDGILPRLVDDSAANRPELFREFPEEKLPIAEDVSKYSL
jgi:hypothetical protein